MRESAGGRDEAMNDVTTPSDREAFENASAAIRNRLTSRGVRLVGGEGANDLVQILDAVERFEISVERRGGDLMVDEDPKGRAE
ncbi:MAG: hypothetical protein ABIT38_20460, partial [Gemmatimonadaceae bacterium]